MVVFLAIYKKRNTLESIEFKIDIIISLNDMLFYRIVGIDAVLKKL
jgi:hypothetical protein